MTRYIFLFISVVSFSIFTPYAIGSDKASSGADTKATPKSQKKYGNDHEGHKDDDNHDDNDKGRKNNDNHKNHSHDE